MSIAIKPETITAVFALGQWHYVAVGTFEIDAYEIIQGDFPDFETIFLEDYYPKEKQAFSGATWEAQCGTQMAMPLFEIKAFKFQRTSK